MSTQKNSKFERTDKNINVDASQERLPLDYFLLVFVLAVPFWLFGGGKLPLPMNLPVVALVTFVPALAASIVMYRRRGANGIKELWKRAVDYKKIKNRIWYLPALLLPPVIYFLSYVAMRVTGLPLPDLINVPILLVPVFFVMFFIGDTGEELGWSGYALDPMQNRWGALKASFILGVVWATWHAIPFMLTHNPVSWVIWQSLRTIAVRIIIVWIYNNTGKSVFATTLNHVTENISWSLFPNFASHYNPFVTGLFTWLTVGVIAFAWVAKTLARYRSIRRSKSLSE